MPTKTTFTFTEKPCLRALHFLKHISFNKFKTISAKKCKNEEDRFQCFNKMKHYVKTALDNRGLLLCNYEYSPNTPRTLGGRLFSLNSIQLVACEIRGLLFKHATDIDISNCHPCLLLYLCKKNNIPCTYLQEYVENRDSVLSQISPDRGEAKHIILCAINDSDKNYKVNNNTFFRAFDNEMKNTQQIITAFPEYKPYRDAVPDDKIYNLVGSAINRILCGFENEILQHCIEMIQETTKFEISTLMFDGLMLDGNYYNNPQLLRDLEIYIESLYPGLNLKFTFKKHDDSIIIPDDFDYNDLIAASLTPDQKEMMDQQNHQTSATVIVELIGDIYVCVDKRNDTWFYYNEQISLWQNECPKHIIYDRLNEVILTAINQTNLRSKSLITVDETCEEVRKLKKQIENYEKFKKQIGYSTFLNSVYSLVKDRLHTERFTDSLNRELFVLPLKNNLVIDLRTNNIYPRERRHNFSIICPVVYDETNIDFGFKYFESLFPDSFTRQCVLDAIKSSMTGVPLRNIFFWIGSGRNGKSLLLNVVRTILSHFCGVVPKNIVINSKSASNITSELESLSTVRFGEISELAYTDTLNQTRVKEFTGDGVINFRGLFQKEKTIDVTASIHIATNNIPHIDCSDPAMLTRIIPFPFKAVFEVDRDYAELVMSNIDSIFSYIIQAGQIKKSFVIDAMSEEIQDCRREKIIGSDSFVSFVHEHLKRDANERVAVSFFIESYKAHHLAITEETCFLSDRKIMGLLRKLGFEIFRSDSVQYILNSVLST